MSQPPAATPQRYRFVVKSAEEAITVLRQRLGPGARVVSVQQLESGGLTRFLQSPKLEVIAEVPAETPAEAFPALLPPVEESGVQLQFSAAATALVEAQEQAASGLQAELNSRRLEALDKPRLVEPPSEPVDLSASPLTRLLRSAGLPKPLISRLQGEPAWAQWEHASPAQALNQISLWLRQEWRQRQSAPLGQRIAFLGSPGAGKTTALCKQLATDVFCRQRRAIVLKLDLAHANPGDGLAVVCEAFGAIFARDPAELPALAANDTLYVDVPGVSLNDHYYTAELQKALDPLALTGRIVVAHAAYEPALLKRALAWGADLGCAHAVFSHMDELTHWGKLWEFVLQPHLTTLSLGTGQNIAGDLEENVFDALVARTLPQAPEEARTTTAVAA